MNKVFKVYVEMIGDCGCNNGHYPRYIAENGDEGVTCRCYRGCSETDDLSQYAMSEGGCDVELVDIAEFEYVEEQIRRGLNK